MQLESIKVKDKLKIRVKARIPELHTLLPIPVNSLDLIHIANYPTFVGNVDDLNAPEGVDTIPEGSELEVTFGNTNNFTQPKLSKVIRWGVDGVTGPGAPNARGRNAPSAKEASTGGGSKRPTSDDGTGNSEGPDEAALDKQAAKAAAKMGYYVGKDVPFVGVEFTTEALKAAGVPPLSDWRGIKKNEDQWFFGWTPKVKHGWLRLRNDVMVGFVDLYKKVKELGGRMTSSGMLRPISSDKAKGIGEAMFSFHHCGRAFDLATDAAGLGAPKFIKKKVEGKYVRVPKNDKFGANAPFKKKGRIVSSIKPYVVTVNEEDDRFWHVWCQVIDEDKRAAHYAKWGTAPIQIGKYADTANLPTPPEGDPTGDGGLVEQYKQTLAAYKEKMASQLGSEGQLHAPASNKEVAVRRLKVLVKKGGSRFMTVDQDVLCFSFTDWAQEFGFDHIGCAQWKKKPRQIAASKVGIPTPCLEWWHFQSPINLTKGQLYIDDIRQIYSEKKIAKVWGRTIHWCSTEFNLEGANAGDFVQTAKKKKVMYSGAWPRGISDQIYLKTMKMWSMRKGKAQLKGWVAGKCGTTIHGMQPCKPGLMKKKPKKGTPLDKAMKAGETGPGSSHSGNSSPKK